MPPVAENARRSDAVVCTNKTHMLLLEVLCELLHRNETNTLIFMQMGRQQVFRQLRRRPYRAFAQTLAVAPRLSRRCYGSVRVSAAVPILLWIQAQLKPNKTPSADSAHWNFRAVNRLSRLCRCLGRSAWPRARQMVSTPRQLHFFSIWFRRM